MYQAAYHEANDDAPDEARAAERRAFDRAIDLMQQAVGPTSPVAAAKALAFVKQLWGELMQDLATEENDLPPRLRASLISIGVWVLRTAEASPAAGDPRFRELVEIHQIVRAGMR